MIIDSSAILAIVRQEPGFEDILERMDEAGSVSAGTPPLGGSTADGRDAPVGRVGGIRRRHMSSLRHRICSQHGSPLGMDLPIRYSRSSSNASTRACSMQVWASQTLFTVKG